MDGKRQRNIFQIFTKKFTMILCKICGINHVFCRQFTRKITLRKEEDEEQLLEFVRRRSTVIWRIFILSIENKPGDVI